MWYIFLMLKKEMNNLMHEVRDYEPKIALTDFNNGLVFYKRIAWISREILKPDSWIILEVGLNILMSPLKIKLNHIKIFQGISIK